MEKNKYTTSQPAERKCEQPGSAYITGNGEKTNTPPASQPSEMRAARQRLSPGMEKNKYTTSQPAERKCEQPGSAYHREWRKNKCTSQPASREKMRPAHASHFFKWSLTTRPARPGSNWCLLFESRKSFKK
jgi:hypothetical protein